ncbi:MAG: hypothetical protein OEY52_11705 [Gammaproteobacteria bacterium]|nr:hypothetical protein [Gammaproteobacteria bacterium]
MRLISSTLFAFVWLLVTGCASITSKDAVTNKDVTIKNVASDAATINLVNVTSSTAGTTIRGQLRRKYTATGPIPGYLNVKIVRPDGSVQYSGKLDYRRLNRNSKYSKFALSLDDAISKGSTVQITHQETANIISGDIRSQ